MLPLLALAFAAAGCSAPVDQAAQRPNILLFVVDDMGWQDTSVPFHSRRTPLNDRYRTPNMERLAAEGMKFTQFCASPVCSPSRVSLLTGLNAAHHMVTNWTLEPGKKTDRPDPAFAPPDWNVNGVTNAPGQPLSVLAETLPQALKRQGYKMIHIGKAHFGAIGTPGADPLHLGFDVNVAGHAAGGPGSYLPERMYGNDVPGPWGVPGLEKYYGSQTFLTDALTREAIAQLRKATTEGRPFFLHLAHYAVHVPLDPDARFVGRYLAEGLDPKEARYAALVEGMDLSLGQVLDELKALGQERNTVVFFVSDNGGLSAEGRGGAPNTHNLPLKSGKGSAYEGGLRVPCIVKWPGVAQPGSTCATPVIIEDLFSTALEVAGAKSPKVDGRSFANLLRGRRDARDRTLVWHYPNFWGPHGPGIEPFSAIRRGDWKLIYFHMSRRVELYDLGHDVGEEHDLASAEPKRAAELARLLGRKLKGWGAKMTIEKASGKPVPFPG